MSKSRPSVTHEFTFNGNAEHVTHSVGDIIIGPNTSPEEIAALRKKQLDMLVQQGGVTIKTVIGPGANLKSVTAGAYNITFPSPPIAPPLSSLEKMKANPELQVTDDETILTVKIPIKQKGEAVLIFAKTPGQKNDIHITPQVQNFYSAATVHWDGKMQYKYLKAGIYHLNASNYNSEWKTDNELESAAKAASNLISKPVTSASSTQRPSLYTSTSPAVFKSTEIKPMSSESISKIVLPTIKELNDILGRTGLVTEVRPGHSIIHTSLSITFNDSIDSNSYEQILKEKLLDGIPNVNLIKTSIYTKIEIPDDAKIYARFKQNFDKALNEINTPKLSNH